MTGPVWTVEDSRGWYYCGEGCCGEPPKFAYHSSHDEGFHVRGVNRRPEVVERRLNRWGVMFLTALRHEVTCKKRPKTEGFRLEYKEAYV